jgi:ADP-ribose pyrophosphatase
VSSRVTAAADKPEIADAFCNGQLSASKVLGTGFCRYERSSFISATPSCTDQTRDILRAGRSAAVLPLDLARREVVLLRQFRLAAQVANGRGKLVEIVAGHVDAQDHPADTARRECLEEIGLAPAPLIELLTYFPSPGISDEQITLFLGIVNALMLSQQGGLASEHEALALMRVPIDVPLAALTQGVIHNGPLIVALQWLALNRERLPEIVARG